ncbi:MAG: glycosyltransferase family 2 protein [Candidatus Aenigmarchaeota archaeon]|nr:glycosyltransferase family 2 protein [Candidatus Aenigmarchaeota archaeon]
MAKKIVVVIPAKNEQDTIGGMVKRIQDVGKKHKLDFKVLVVSDSRDKTMEVAEKAGARAVRGDGKGLGAAMFRGLKAAAEMDADIIVSIDADGQTEPEEIPNVVSPVLSGEADLVIGSRFLDKSLMEYRMPLMNRLGNKSLSWMVRRITRLPITDAQAGFRAMRREVAESLEMIGTHTYVQETIIDAAKKGFRIKEVPSAWKRRSFGRSKVVASAKRYFAWTLPILLLRAGWHTMLFTFLGILLTVAGFIVGLSVLAIENFNIIRTFNHIPALILTALLILLGVLLFFFGFMLSIMIEIKNRVDKK